MFSFLFCLLETAATRKTVNFLFFVIFLLENSLKKIRATIRLQLNGNTELARPVVVMMAQTKRIFILIIKVNKLFSVFLPRNFLKDIEDMFSIFLKNTCRSLGELEKAVETLACRLVFPRQNRFMVRHVVTRFNKHL